jgi:hypothetical protein
MQGGLASARVLRKNPGIDRTRNPPSPANVRDMVGYAWDNAVRTIGTLATLTHPTTLVM